MGVVDDKDINKLLKVFPKGAIYYFTQADIPRALNFEKLAHIADESMLQGQSFLSVKKAYQNALKYAKHNDLIFVGGSTFIVADLLKYLEK